MAHHVDQSPPSAMFCQTVLVLTLGDAHMMLDAQVGEKLLESIACALTCAVGVQDAKALRALALCQVVIHSLSVDSVLLVGLDRVVDTADGVIQGIDVHDELLHDGG